jgi:zinc protease
MSKDFARYCRVGATQVTQTAKQFLGPGRVVVEVVPGSQVSLEPNPLVRAEAARAQMAKQLPALPAFSPQAGTMYPWSAEGTGRESLPEGAAEPAFSLPPVKRAVLSNGMQLLLVEKHELPLVNLHVVFPAGRANDGQQTPGLAEMTAAVWDEGTAKRSAEEIAAELGGLGASISVSADWDTTSARLFSLKRHLPKALEIFADVLREPSFPVQELHRQQIAAIGRLTQVRNEPTVLASLAAAQLLYGYDHPYGHPHGGSPAVIKGLKPAALKQFYDTHMRPEQAAVIAVGDIALDELKQQLEAALGTWKSASSEPVDPDFALPQTRPTSLVLIDKPHAAQSVIHVALVGTRRNTPDFFPQTVMNMVFGGQFSSRLNLNLREQKGYTYGARSSWDWRVHERGPFVATSSVQTAVTAPALTEFLKELDGMVGARPVEEKELDFCKKYVTRGYTGGFETPAQVATQLETLFVYKLPDDYFNSVVPGVRAVTAEDTMRVAKKYLALDRLAIVVVGDRATIEPELRKLPIGKNLTVYQFDDEFRLLPVKP